MILDTCLVRQGTRATWVLPVLLPSYLTFGTFFCFCAGVVLSDLDRELHGSRVCDITPKNQSSWTPAAAGAAAAVTACRWGGPNEFYSGHMANGRRVVTDGKASTRHVIAGLAEALGGEQQQQGLWGRWVDEGG
jgi:hypothetical protein